MGAVLSEDLIYEILSVVEEIPYGCVASYGQIASLIGREKNARLVGKGLSMSQFYGDYPCHRVVKRDGEVSSAFAFGGANRQVELLRAEGVTFADESHVDMARCCVRAIPLVL